MKTIFKYTLYTTGSTPTEYVAKDVPEDARLRKVAIQYGRLRAWYEVDTEQPKGDRHFFVVGTGWEMPKLVKGMAANYTDTIFDGEFVWHVYEIYDHAAFIRRVEQTTGMKHSENK